jgi:hypothetical protein
LTDLSRLYGNDTQRKFINNIILHVPVHASRRKRVKKLVARNQLKKINPTNQLYAATVKAFLAAAGVSSMYMMLFLYRYR